LAQASRITSSSAGVLRKDATLSSQGIWIVSSSGSLVRDDHKANWLERATDDLLHWLNEPDGWDSYGANRITLQAVRRAHTILKGLAQFDIPAPLISGTSEGGVSCDWDADDLAVQINVESNLQESSVFIWDKISGQEREGSLEALVEELADALWRLSTSD
jgi:hypothetical protein